MPHEIAWSLVRTVQPGQLVSTGEQKDHMRVVLSTEDGLIDGLLLAAQEAVEEELSRATLTQTWELRLDRFPGWSMRIPRPPLDSVTSIQYVDNDGNTQTLAVSDYTVDSNLEPARIVPAHGESWPTTRDVPAAVTVTYTAGDANATDVPEMVRLAVKMTAADLYENRERSADQALQELIFYERLIANYRVYHEFRYI